MSSPPSHSGALAFVHKETTMLSVQALYVKTTKNFHRFDIADGSPVTGQIYIPLVSLPSALSADFPKSITVEVKVPGRD